MLTRNLIRSKDLNPDKESYVINIQAEIDNRHPDESLNVLNTSNMAFSTTGLFITELGAWTGGDCVFMENDFLHALF